MRYGIGAALAAVVAFTLVLPAQAQGPEATVSEPPLVKLQVLAADEAQSLRQFFGRVAARETVDLAFQVGGQLEEFPVLEGTTVEKGGLIARLDLEPFTLALDQARVRADQAARTRDRLQKLQGNAVSAVAVDDARTQAELTTLAVRNAERSLSQATLHAPFNALVATRKVANFSTVAAGKSVVRLHDMSELRVEIDVPEVLFRSVGRDTDYRIYATFPDSDGEYALTTREYDAETSGVGQTFRISLGMEPPTDMTVLPGASVTVNVIRDWTDSRPSLPISAVLTENDGSAALMVFTPSEADPDRGTVARVPVSIEPTDDGRVFVTSGLEPGAEVVASGAGLLEDGATVRRFSSFGS